MQVLGDVLIVLGALCFLPLIWCKASSATRSYLPTAFAGVIFWLPLLSRGLLGGAADLLSVALAQFVPRSLSHYGSAFDIGWYNLSLLGWLVVTAIILIPVAWLNRFFVDRESLSGKKAALLAIAPTLVIYGLGTAAIYSCFGCRAP